MLVRRAGFGAIGVVFALVCACGGGGGAQVTTTKPVTTDLQQYKSCVVRLDARDLAEDGDAFVEYLEGQLREGGLEPVDAFHENDADVLLSLVADVESEKSSESKVKIGVQLVDRKSKDVVGELEVRGVGTSSDAAPADRAIRETGGDARRVALHHAADEIVTFLRARRVIRTARPSGSKLPFETHAPMTPPPPPDDPPGAELPPPRTDLQCAVSCVPTASALPDSELQKIASRAEPTIQVLRNCVNRIGGHKIEPALILRFGPDGTLATTKVDLGGYEDLGCVDAARRRPPRVFIRREAIVRCSWHCQ